MQIYVYDNGTKHNLIGDILDNGTPLFSGGDDAELPIADSSYRFSEIMGDDNVVVNFSMPVFFEFPIGCRINVDYTEYSLVELGNVTKQNERWYDYTLTFESPAKQLSRYKFRNHVDGRLNFTLTAQPLEFLTHIITNLNQREGANNWMLGDCIVSSEKTQSFSHNTILDALNAVAQLFETEWEIVNKTISLKKVEYNKANPITLSYGKGNGFISGIARQLSGEKAVDVLWVEGGDRNIDSQTYTYQKTISGQTQTLHANKLRLPRNAQFVYVPSDNEPDQYGNIDRGTIFTLAAWNALTPEQRAQYTDYMQVYTDEDGFGVFRSAYINNGYEESLEATDIYPKKVLTVTAVTESNPSNHFWEIKDSNNDVDYANCIIGGEDATIIFQSGMLTGKEFNWSKYTHSTKQFDIVPQEIDGITIPDRPSGYIPVVGDTFAVFHIALPQQYITNAEQELLLTACEYLYKHGEVEVEFNGTVDGIWAKRNWDALVPYFKVGGYIRFTDSKLVTEGKLMRILSIKTYLNNPHSPEITLSNSSVSQSVSSELKKIPQNQVYQHNELQQQISYTQRSFRDTKETQKALEEAIENIDTDFTESISPVSVQTMQMIVGSDNLQFAFGTATTTPQSGKEKVTGFTVQTWNPTYANGSLTCTATHLKHYTIASNYVTSGDGSASKYPYWSVSSANLTPPDPDKFYYLYVVCPKSGTSSANLGYLTSSAYFTLSETPQSHTSANYFMLVGILNKQREGSRSFASMYGYTEITGNRISTDRIVSADGRTYFDLTTGEISSASPIKFTYNGTSNTDLDTLLQTINSTASTANTNATNAQGTASTASSNASAALTAANGANSTANSALSTANTANSNANTALNTVNNLKIGGTNLLRQSNIAIMNLASDTYPLTMNSHSVYLSETIPAGTDITISCQIKATNVVWATTGNYHRVGVEGNTGTSPNYYYGAWLGKETGVGTTLFNGGNFYGRVSATFKLSVDLDKSRPFLIYIQGLASGNISVFNPQIEIGTISTDWSLAQEDIVGRNLVTKEWSGSKRSDIITSAYGLEITTPNADTYFTIHTHSNLKPNYTYTLSCYVEGVENQNYYKFPILGNSQKVNVDYFTIRNGFCVCQIRGFNGNSIWLDDASRNMQQTTHIKISNIKIELGSIATDWSPAPEDGDASYLANRAIFSALQDSTDISGGLVLTNAILLKAAGGAINSGISGLNATTAGKNPRFWAGGNYTDAVNAANDSNMDVPTHSLPILFTDQGYNSNIGIFKVLDGAIAVMRNGQVVRISTAAFSTEQTNFAPAAPFNHTLSSGGRLNFTSTSTSQTSHTRDFTGLFSKTANYNITIAQTSVKLYLSENRTTYFSGSCTTTLTVTLQIKAGNKTQTIYTGSITRTQSSVASGSTYPFENTQTLTVPAASVNNVQITSGNRIQLIATLSSSATGSTAVTSRADYYELAAQMVATNSENNSCFILANGGFECAYSATKALFFNAINGLFSFQGSNFLINGKDFAVDKTKTVALGSGSLIIQRIGFLVTMKITIPKAYLATSGVIPSGYRPSIATTVLVCTAAADGTVYQLDISTSGGMTCGSLPNNTIAYGSATYICTETYPS